MFLVKCTVFSVNFARKTEMFSKKTVNFAEKTGLKLKLVIFIVHFSECGERKIFGEKRKCQMTFVKGFSRLKCYAESDENIISPQKERLRLMAEVFGRLNVIFYLFSVLPILRASNHRCTDSVIRAL